MKRILRFLTIFLLSGILLGLGGLLALTLYYRNNFPVNTWINGVYCTGKSIEQVNEELVGAQEESEVSLITIVDADGAGWEIDMRAADIRPDYRDALRAYLKQNASVYWMDNLQEPVSSELAAGKYAVDREKLQTCLEGLPFMEEERKRAEGVRVRKSEEGFVLQDGNADRLNPEKACAYVEECLAKGQTAIDLAAGGCYEDLPDSAYDRRQRDIWEQVSAYAERGSRIVYDMGAEQIPLTPAVTSGFLKTERDGCPVLDEEGGVVIDEAMLQAWVEALAADYDTCGSEKQFQSTRGDLVTVNYVTYGTKLDVEAEKAYLLEALQNRAGNQAADPGEDTGTQGAADSDVPDGTEMHVPAYIQKGYVRGLDDIGDTYIEIDMTEQKMYYYAAGELELETDIVTGNTGRRMGTPQGINYIHGKQRNQILRGADYESFVKYWVPVVGNIGIHDASWRGSFGGQIYQTGGSHGCINTPTANMSQLYEMVEVGMPVIMFY